ncbi:unnamed protein product [Nesidiocoris tenuis]|uniref:Uncharacterized protein n=1 Tax=Nesidiocoris tenuis TaxID=355587 RepID=A0A6H5HBT5_9HEMI|nr:unnamed protein product [Nesidiocoris tenuis]
MEGLLFRATPMCVSHRSMRFARDGPAYALLYRARVASTSAQNWHFQRQSQRGCPGQRDKELSSVIGGIDDCIQMPDRTHYSRCMWVCLGISTRILPSTYYRRYQGIHFAFRPEYKTISPRTKILFSLNLDHLQYLRNFVVPRTCRVFHDDVIERAAPLNNPPGSSGRTFRALTRSGVPLPKHRAFRITTDSLPNEILPIPIHPERLRIHKISEFIEKVSLLAIPHV